MKAYYLIILATIALISIGCNKDEDSSITNLNVSKVNLIELGSDAEQIPFEIKKSVEFDNEYRCTFTFRTLNIRKGDNIDILRASIQNKTISINVVTTPNDFNCNEISCFSKHEISFNITDFKKGTYTINLGVNNVFGENFSYNIK